MTLQIAQWLAGLSAAISLCVMGYLIAYNIKRRRIRTQMTDYDFSDMQYIQQGNGVTAPSIPFDEKWDNLTKLRWHAAVYNAQVKEVVISVHPSEPENHWPGSFQISVESTVDHRASFSGPFSFNSAWTYINGVGCGSDMVRVVKRGV